MDAIASSRPDGHGRTAFVMAEIRARIARGALTTGARLPSVRRSAELFHVSPSTVVQAYERLVATGEITSRPGSGFYVAVRCRPATLADTAARPEPEIDPLWVMRQSLEPDEGRLQPGCGWLPESWMPAEEIRRAVRAELRGAVAPLVSYAPPLGFEPLRALLARRAGERQIAARPDQILLTHSSTQAIDLICRLFLRAGDVVVVDDPCYFNFLNILRAHRVDIVGVPYTPDGPDLECLGRVFADRSPVLYVTTGGPQNPTGGTPLLHVQHGLLKLAERHDVIVVEDDVWGELETQPSSRLAACDGLERVIYLGGFSKTLSAALRCGFIAARPDWIAGLTDLKLATSFGHNDFVARVLHRILVEGAYRRHLDGIRRRLLQAHEVTMTRTRRCRAAAMGSAVHRRLRLGGAAGWWRRRRRQPTRPAGRRGACPGRCLQRWPECRKLFPLQRRAMHGPAYFRCAGECDGRPERPAVDFRPFPVTRPIRGVLPQRRKAAANRVQPPLPGPLPQDGPPSTSAGDSAATPHTHCRPPIRTSATAAAG